MKSIFYSFFAVILLLGCGGDTAEDFNKSYVTLDQNITQGKLVSFENAKEQLDSLKRSCEKHKADIEFKTDDESVRELANVDKVLGKISSRLTALNNEKQVFEKVYTAGKESFQTIESCNNYLRQFPDGLKRSEVETEYNTILSNFMDDVAGQLQTNFTGLSESNTERSIYQLANFTNEKVGGELVEYGEEDYETALTHFGNAKAQITQVLNTVTTEIKTAKGNTPQRLKELFNDYDGKLNDMRAKREVMIRQLVQEEFQKNNWEGRARGEITNYVALDRRSFLLDCKPYELSNDIQRAEEDQMTMLSNKIEIKLHFNVNSYCSASGKYKYYDAKFSLVFPIIESQLGSGFFDAKNIYKK